jgi:hypothetical protein
MAEQIAYVIGTRIKELISETKNPNGDGNMRTAGDFIDALSAETEELVSKAIRRAQANGRGTVRAADL